MNEEHMVAIAHWKPAPDQQRLAHNVCSGVLDLGVGHGCSKNKQCQSTAKRLQVVCSLQGKKWTVDATTMPVASTVMGCSCHSRQKSMETMSWPRVTDVAAEHSACYEELAIRTWPH